MLSVDRDALLCDMAETYGVYDLRALSVDTLATLSFGLRENSRIKQKLMGHKYVPQEFLLACVADRLAVLQYQLFGSETDEKPLLFYDLLYGEEEEEPHGYANGEEFRQAWKDLTEGVTHGGSR